MRSSLEMTPTRMKYCPLEENVLQIDAYYMRLCPHATNSWFQESRAEQEWFYLRLRLEPTSYMA